MFKDILYFWKRKIDPGFKVKKNDLVIDIGSGDKPFWRGDVFFDKLALADNQRITETGVIQNLGMFINGDLLETPFKDKAFDFSFCAHTLEHVERPDVAIEEIMRISKSGYIEIPNGLLESIDPYQSHLWFVYLNGKKLVFVRKSKKMHKVLAQNNLGEEGKAWTQPGTPFIRLYWYHKIEYEIIDVLKEEEKFKPVFESKPNGGSPVLYLLLIRFLRLMFYTRKEDLNVLKLKRHRH
ncbi:MAG: hypothetical protein UV07_C0003G0026 [Candidatus Azambacteria bacterium GW2011_GWB1_42_17]|uniref:Methyltransferase type 11 domain-containing protein n=1 Tax=Candidatus Azambacteria bacterium GW2011_GWB1_42_17 TaxID=1618615 RepID=A0A0G1BEJ6_9BACT|nr:MAG: hypothetical protein UV07_C0003G0026 [Candidatus Azambacteria bacterium GW2011_GWB1_42_17]